MADKAAYKLHITKGSRILWISRIRKPPKLYLEIRLRGLTMRTAVIKESTEPNWNEEFLLSAKPSELLSFRVRHDTSKPFLPDPVLGGVEIGIIELLEKCKHKQEATLGLGALQGQTDTQGRGTITVLLSTLHPNEAGKSAITTVRHDIQSRGFAGFVNSTDVEGNNYLCHLQTVVTKLETLVQVVDQVASAHPYAMLAWQVTSSVYQVLKQQIDRDKRIFDLVATMEDVYSFVDVIQLLPNKLELLEDIIVKILKQTVECAMFIREYTGHGFAGMCAIADLKWLTIKHDQTRDFEKDRVKIQIISNYNQTIENLSRSLVTLKQSFDSGAILHTAFVSSRMSESVEKLIKTENIRTLDPVRMDAFSRPECLPGTRLDILEQITIWLTTPAPNGQNVFWLHGLVGSGKSTVATTIAEQFRELGRLGAFLFFNRDDPTHSDPTAVVRTLAHQLATFDPYIASAISTKIETLPRIGEASIRLQFANLLVEPLLSFAERHTQGPIIIVIDALDECGNLRSRKDLIARLAEELAKLPPMFRVFITSRAESDIEAAFSPQSNILRVELDITTQTSTADIVSYIRHRMATIRKGSMYNLSSDWPGEGRIQALADLSAGLFIWASTAATFIEEGHNPEEQLDIILSSESRIKAESALDALYATALETAGKWNNEAFTSNFRAVLGIILVARTPLSDGTIDQILGLTEYRRSQFILSRLGCLLQWNAGQPVRVLHASIADYLSDPHRCGKYPWFIDIPAHTQRLALACLRIMKAELRFNICNLQTSYLCNDDVPDLAIRTDAVVDGHLSYSCRFWADHLQATSFDDRILEEVKDFLYHRLLYWFEVLSLIKGVSLASRALLSTSNWVKDHDKSIAAFATDASRFVTTFQRPISHSVPHIYLSALPFSPINSKVSQQFLPQFPQTLSIQTGKATNWPAIINVLEGHNHSVTSIAFSPDGKLIASGSDDHTIRVWDAETGDAVAGPFKGHTGGVKSVSFSPDGKSIASGSVDHTIQVWDAETGNIVSGPFQGHTARVTSVAFSPEGERIASGSWDKTIRIWDASTGDMVSGPFQGHTDAVNSVTFSPDGKRVASGSADKTIRIWQADTGNLVSEPFEGHTSSVTSVAFSPSGTQIVTGSWDETVRVWNAETGDIITGPLEGHADSVLCVAFSPDGKRIVSGSGDKTIQVWGADATDIVSSSLELVSKRIVSRSPHQTIRVWDVQTGEDLSGPFQGHADWMNTVAFSPNGKLIVSGSGDKTIQVWDAEAGEVKLGASEGHSRGVRAVALSPDGKRIVSGSVDQTVRIWDAETGDSVSGPCVGHASRVTSVTFSPNGDRVASGSIDQTVRVWDAETGNAVAGPFKGHTGGVRAVTFSPDGRWIASGSIDQTIRVWDAVTGDAVSAPFKGHTDRITSVTFSPDSMRIASGSWDQTIRIWDAKTGDTLIGPFEGHTNWVNWVAFSPDGKQIVSASEDQTVRLWDAETGDIVSKPFEGHLHSVNCVAFSLDGKRIVSCSADKTIRVWDAKTGKEVNMPFEGHTDWVNAVTFSPNGKRIVSCSGDKTVQVWNAESTDVMIQQTAPGGLRHESRLDNGWTLGSQSELLFWVPPTNRLGLWQPRSVVIISHMSTKLDFSRFVHGTSWQHCRQQ